MKKTLRRPTFGDRVFKFHKTIVLPRTSSREIKIIYPHGNAEVLRHTKRFFNAFFQDKKERIFVFGINPGRFGSGITGIPFTDPVALQDFCGIENTLEKRRELSSQFIYQFIELWGGARVFYKQFFLTAVSPIGFMRDGINYNYYDDPRLFSALRPFIINSMEAQLAFGARRDVAIVLGTGKNHKLFNELNQRHGFFRKVYAVEHPRFIMQYRRKHVSRYLGKYQRVFAEALAC